MNIFITIGTQEPFDRLIKIMDEIVGDLKEYNLSVQAQVSSSTYLAKNIKTFSFIKPIEFELKLNQADLIISHAGMGTIIAALTMNKPIIVMPRLAKLGEHRNEHQLATAKELESLKYIYIAYSEIQLKRYIKYAIDSDLKPLHQIGKYASSTLIDGIREFIKK